MRWRRSRSTDIDEDLADGAGTGAVDGGAEPTAMGLRRRRAGASPRIFSVATTRRAGDAGCCFGVRDGPEDVSRKSRTSRFVRSILGTGFDEGGCGGRAVSTTGGARAAAARRPRSRARRASRSSRSDTTESSAESSSALGWWGRSRGGGGGGGGPASSESQDAATSAPCWTRDRDDAASASSARPTASHSAAASRRDDARSSEISDSRDLSAASRAWTSRAV